jgi:hypothetical protein
MSRSKRVRDESGSNEETSDLETVSPRSKRIRNEEGDYESDEELDDLATQCADEHLRQKIAQTRDESLNVQIYAPSRLYPEC